MKAIKFTQAGGEALPVWVHVEAVMAIEQDEDGTSVLYLIGGRSIAVAEAPEAVVAELEKVPA